MTTLEINNQTVESFLNEQANKNNTSMTNYLITLVMTEIEIASVRNDMKTLETEMSQINKGETKLQPAHLLLNEL